MARFQVTGINDKRDFCECCGKNGLQRVVWIVDTETGDEKHFGTSCATRPAKGFDCVEEIKDAIKRHGEMQKMAYIRASRRYRAEGGAYINDRDAKGSPIAYPANQGRWDELAKEELAA